MSKNPEKVKQSAMMNGLWSTDLLVLFVIDWTIVNQQHINTKKMHQRIWCYTDKIRFSPKISNTHDIKHHSSQAKRAYSSLVETTKHVFDKGKKNQGTISGRCQQLKCEAEKPSHSMTINKHGNTSLWNSKGKIKCITSIHVYGIPSTYN